MVALGNNRNNGSNLGAFYLNANNTLGNSNGNNWRSRASLGWLMATRRMRIIYDKIKKEKIQCRCTLIQILNLTN